MRPGGLSLTARLLEKGCLTEGAEILDAGCGHGTAVAYLQKRGYQAVGLDRSAELIEEARQAHPSAVFVYGQAEAIPFPDHSFDAILSECVLSVSQTAQALAECARVLKPGGILLASDLYSKTEGSRFSGEWWGGKLRTAGFQVFYQEDHTRELRRFAAQLLWKTGGLTQVLPCVDGATWDWEYFSLAARRKI